MAPRIAPTAVLAFAVLAAGCRYPATQVLVRLDTDAPPDRAMTIEATVRAAPDGAGETHRWVRGAPGGIELPATFTLVPGAGPRDGRVVVELTAAVAPAATTAAPVVIHRVARFSFTPRATTAVTLILSVRCGAPASGCAQHDAAACTVGTLCEEQGLTCGNQGECVSPDITPVVVPPDQIPHPDAAATDVTAPDAPVSDAQDAAADAPPDAATTPSLCPVPLPPAWLFCDDFEGGEFPARYNSTSSLAQLGLVADHAASGTHSLQASYTAGSNPAEYAWVGIGRNPVWSSTLRPTQDFTDVYWRLRVLHDVGWVGNPQALTRAGVLANPPMGFAARAILGGVVGDTTLDGDPATCVSAGAVSCMQLFEPGYRYLGQFPGATPLYSAAVATRWNCVEAHMRLNTPGVADGVLEFWINDVLDGSRSDLDWRGTFVAYGINAVGIETGWSGGAPRDERRWYDDFVIATSRIGCR